MATNNAPYQAQTTTGLRRWTIMCAAFFGLAACSPSPPQTFAEPPQTSQLWREYLSKPVTERSFIDFSHAGVFYGDQSLPDLEGLPVFRPEDHGARAGDGLDDTLAVQAAVDAANRAGGGVVQFGAGRYLLNSDPATGSLEVSGSNIVLRGAGQTATQLHMAEPMPPAEPGKKWTGPAMIRFAAGGAQGPSSSQADNRSGATITGARIIPIGATRIPISDASGLAPGDYVLFSMQSLSANASFTAGKELRDHWRTIQEMGVGAREIHRVANVEGNVLVLERPLMTPLDPALPWRVSKQKMLEQVGVQDLTFSTSWTDPFEHHKDARHDSGYRAIELAHTVDSWVSNVTFRNVSTAVSVRGGLANSVLSNTIDGNGGHFSFQAEFSTRTLIAMNVDAARGGQWHGPGASHMSVGTVVWRYISPTSRGIDMHALFPRHTLIDNVTMKGFGSWGGNSRNLPNHLGGLVIWNFTQTGDHVGNHFDGTLDFWDLPEDDVQAYGFLTAVDPVVVGYRGPVTRFNHENAVVESAGVQASPASLYEAQLRLRLGQLPDWITFTQSEWEGIVQREARTDD